MQRTQYLLKSPKGQRWGCAYLPDKRKTGCKEVWTPHLQDPVSVRNQRGSGFLENGLWASEGRASVCRVEK